jgi:hypothetical protein
MKDLLKGTIDLDERVKNLALPDKKEVVKKAEGQSVRKQLMETFESIGGDQEFARFVKKDDRNKREFYGWWAKLAPKEDGVQGTNIQINIVNYNGKPDDTIQVQPQDISASTV